MSAALPSRPRLALPFTVVGEGDMVHLIAGEDIRYSIPAGGIAAALADLLRRCDGTSTLDTLLRPISEAERPAVVELLGRLHGERILLPGPAEAAHVPARFRLQVEGSGRLAERLAEPISDLKALAVLCQDTLDHDAALRFNRRCLAGGSPWLWATTGPLSRGFISPVFLPDAGPCLACLLGHFQRLSPTPQLYEALRRHGEAGGAFTAAPFPAEGLAVLEQLARWKAGQLAQPLPPSAVFRLHVLELETMEVSVHRVFLDPTCAECGDDRLV